MWWWSGKPMTLSAVLKMLCLAVPLSFVGVLDAQDPSTTPQSTGPAKDTSATGVYSGREVFVPNTKEPDEAEPSARAFGDAFLRDTRQHVGFSLGVSQA